MNQAILDRLWKDAEPNFFGTRDDFKKQWDGWETVTVNEAGQMAFVAMVKGPTFHFHSFSFGKSLSRAHITAFLQSIIDRHGYAETRTPLTDGRQQRFNHRLGFFEVGRDEYDIVYKIEHIGYRKAKCQ